MLKDVVRIVRRFRPQVIVSVFSGTPRDGHGQHQAAGWAAREAFQAAGDATRFPELAREEGLAPWTPLKLYRSTWFDTTATTLVLEGGGLDRAAGLSYHQIAMAGRSLHRSQDMGRIQATGAVEGAARTGRGSNRAGCGRPVLRNRYDGIARAQRPAQRRARSGGLRRPPGPISPGCWRSGHGGRPRGSRPTAWRTWTARSSPPRASCAMPGATTIASCPGSGSPSRSSAGTREPSRTTLRPTLRGGRAIRPDSAAATLRLAPGALVRRQVTVTVAPDAPSDGARIST